MAFGVSVCRKWLGSSSTDPGVLDLGSDLQGDME